MRGNASADEAESSADGGRTASSRPLLARRLKTHSLTGYVGRRGSFGVQEGDRTGSRGSALRIGSSARTGAAESSMPGRSRCGRRSRAIADVGQLVFAQHKEQDGTRHLRSCSKTPPLTVRQPTTTEPADMPDPRAAGSSIYSETPDSPVAATERTVFQTNFGFDSDQSESTSVTTACTVLRWDEGPVAASDFAFSVAPTFIRHGDLVTEIHYCQNPPHTSEGARFDQNTTNGSAHVDRGRPLERLVVYESVECHWFRAPESRCALRWPISSFEFLPNASRARRIRSRQSVSAVPSMSV